MADVLASKPIAPPLRLMDCCPISDGAATFVVSREPTDGGGALRLRGAAHTHQHVTAAPSLTQFGAAASSARAFKEAGVTLDDVGYAAVYDSFTITLAILLEEIGLSRQGESGRDAASGRYDASGDLPLNTHGGLLAYGHCGVAGALAHLAETHRQLTRRAGNRQIRAEPSLALLHGDGGIMSSHVSMVLEARPMSETLPDWTEGGSGLVVHGCAGCGHHWYFRRVFCPNCGSSDVAATASAGLGTVFGAAQPRLGRRGARGVPGY